jgi:2-dehydropantoate 2-reductase
MGMLLAMRLAEVGVAVRLLDYRADRARRLDEKGVTLIEADGRASCRQIPCSTDARAADPAPLVFLAVKAYDTETALVRAMEAMAPGGVLVSLQNGIRHVELIRRYLASDQTVFGTTGQGATRVETGTVRHCGAGDTLIAAEEHNRHRAAETAALLARAGVPASCVDDLPFILWRKLLFNAAINPITAVLGIRNGQIARIRGAWELAVSCFREAREVAGAVVGPEMLQVMEEDLRDLCEKTADNTSSMLQDVKTGKRTEITALNEVVVEEARRCRVGAPVNQVVVQLITALEEARR